MFRGSLGCAGGFQKKNKKNLWTIPVEETKTKSNYTDNIQAIIMKLVHGSSKEFNLVE